MIKHEMVAMIARRAQASPTDVVNAFRLSTGEDLARLRASAAAGRCEELALQAHRLQGASELLGAEALTRAARRLQAAASRGDRAGLAGALALVEQEARALDTYLEALDVP